MRYGRAGCGYKRTEAGRSTSVLHRSVSEGRALDLALLQVSLVPRVIGRAWEEAAAATRVAVVRTMRAGDCLAPSLGVSVNQTLGRRSQMQCLMRLLPSHRTFSLHDAAAGVDCRRQRLVASSATDCASACLAQPFCEASTWFVPTHPVVTLRGVCIGRTAGTPRGV